MRCETMKAGRSKLGQVLAGRLLAVSLLAVGLLAAKVLAAAEVPEAWHAEGPDGGLVYDLAVSPAAPDTLWAAGRLILFVSRDAGTSWQLVAPSPYGLQALVADAGQPDRLYATTVEHLLRSDDGGLHWQSIEPDPEYPSGPQPKRMAVHPSLSGRLVLAYEQGTFTSSDGGDSWTQLPDAGELRICGVTIHPAPPHNLYGERCSDYPAADGTYRSQDAGATWERISDFPPFDLFGDPHDPQGLLNLYGYSIFHSGDGGVTWDVATGLPPATRPSHLAYSPQVPGLVLTDAFGDGFYRSLDGGLTWMPAAEHLRQPLLIRMAVTPDGTAYAATNQGLYRSHDDGDHWRLEQRGLQATEMVSLNVHPRDPSLVVASVGFHGLYVSHSGGRGWQRLKDPRVRTTGAVALDPSDPAKLYTVANGGIARSLNGGDRWGLAKLDHSLHIEALAVHPGNGKIVYAAGSTVTQTYPLPQLLRSQNQGGSWQVLPGPGQGHIRSVRFDPRDSSVMYLGGDGGLFRSTDEGVTWTQLTSWNPTDRRPVVLDLAFDPADPDTFYLATQEDGVLRTDDGCASFLPAEEGLPEAAVLSLAATPAGVFAGTSAGLFQSTDGGRTWSPAAGNRGLEAEVTTLAVDPLRPDLVYAGTTGAGVLQGTPAPAPCVASDRYLCLNGGRFQVEVEWTDFQGRSGQGIARPITGDTGYFEFFHRGNVELVVKALDGGTVNSNYWLFYGALTNVQYLMRVTDTLTGEVRTYFNPSRRFASRSDTEAFPRRASEPAPDTTFTPPAPAQAASCAAGDTELCLRDRFRVTVTWTDFQGRHGDGIARSLSGDTGYFWFFQEPNVELVVKVLDGSRVNGHFWVFYGALTNVSYLIEVEDTLTGERRTYFNPPHTLRSFADNHAFAAE